ncbi:hypothetical protein Clacol_002881 [Clathrus columnatus]|uniref:peptidylprolyl isomerase n=1 Tax=Clathrus columnatus TaxID=1419009 RepID=A0AAV5A4U8_9AGAM|nr:hypothetical protein Clacol_002881 [Clathrus columnatus]
MNPRVFLDFAIDGNPIGRVIFELLADVVPKTAENFRALCTGEKGLSLKSQVPLYYKNSIVHRSIPNFMIQGGDFTKRNGLGGESIYGAPFEDEDLSRPVDAEGNGSQFFITLRPCPHLNGKHVVLGRVIRGYDDVIKKITDVPTDERDRPNRPVVIINCGELERRNVVNPPKEERGRRVKEENNAQSELDETDKDREKKQKRHKRKKHRSKSRSLDRSNGRREKDEVDSDNDHRRKKFKVKSKVKERTKTHERSRSPSIPRKETEEEYDARLEREENERLEAARKAELARLKDKFARERESSVINYKGVGTRKIFTSLSRLFNTLISIPGRGRMKYVDPEMIRR